MYKPYPIGYPAGDPGRGHFCIARVSRHAVPKTPGLLRYAYIYDPDRVSLPLAVPIASDALAGSRGKGMTDAYGASTRKGCSPIPKGHAILSDGSDGLGKGR